MRKYAENVQFERENREAVIRAIHEKYDVVSLEEVTDSARQLQGIDWIVTTPTGTVRVDVKVRRMDRIIWDRPESQDLLIEYKQGAGPGWAVHPDALTDDILYVWPDLVGTDYDWCLRIPFKAAKIIANNRVDLLWDGAVKSGLAHNGNTTSSFLIVKIRELTDIVQGLIADIKSRNS